MNQSPIQIRSLTRRFGKTLAVQDLSFDVPEGAIYALVGANGAGKTTLIKLLMNIIPPTSGSSQVLGIDSRELMGRAFEQIGYVSENQKLPESMTVGQMMDYFRFFYPQWDRNLEQQLIRLFDLPLDRKLKNLSRGMKMKAALASSLAYRPRLIVLDEPFSGLDPLVRDELIESLLERAPETTILLSSHDMAEIESFSSHVGYLEQGKLVFNEEMTSLYARFREVTVVLSQPITLPVTIPAAWLLVEQSDTTLRFVHSAFDAQNSVQEIRESVPVASEIAFDPMPLRSIFLAVAKSRRADHKQVSEHEGTSVEGVQA